MTRNDRRPTFRKLTAVSCVAATALAAACGGGSDEPDIQVPQNNGLAAATPAQFTAPASSLTQYELHLNNATANAGKSDLFVTNLRPQWCFTAENSGTPTELGDRAVVPITKIFDDVYFGGFRNVGQFVFKTSRGLFLIDTLNRTSDVQTVTIPGLQNVGLDPATIFGAMPTHGHGDHHGGAEYLQATYRIPIYLGSGDAANKPFLVTSVDSVNMEPQPYAFGDLQTLLLSTPGHTPGTLSGIVPVKHEGKSYKMAFWGGTAMPNTIERARQYLDGAERLYRLSASEKISGTFHTHPFVDGTLRHVDAIRAQGLGAQNPFLIGEQDALRSLAVLRSCSAAKVAQVDATAILPEWRVNTVETAATWIKGKSTDNVSASARVSGPYGVAAAGTVAFTFAPGGETCSAAVNAEGIATCSVSSAGSTQESVTARYQGSDSAQLVSLPASAEATITALN